MSHANKCEYCKCKFKFKFPYKTWAAVAKLLYERSVKRFEPVETITFMFNDKSLIMEDACGRYKPEEDDEYLTIDLVARLSNVQAKEIEKTENNTGCMLSVGYTFPDELPPPDREMKLLQAVGATGGKKDLDIVVDDMFGSGKFHHCGIVSVKGCKNVEIFLKEAYSNER